MLADQTPMGLFQLVAGKGSLSAAARELGISTSAVSKRLARLEQRLGVRLLHRTTRRLSLTDEGEMYLRGASRILADIDDLERRVGSRRVTPQGLIRVNATFGFGRRHVAPALLEFARRYPEIQVQLDLSDRPLSLVEAGYDIGIRVGAPGDTALVARKLVANHRVVCGSPSYLRAHGTPRTPRDLARHDCLILRQDGSGVYRAAEEFLEKRGVALEDLRILMEVEGTGLVESAVVAGLGVALVSRLAARRFGSAVKMVELSGLSATCEVHLVRNMQRAAGHLSLRFWDFIQKPETQAMVAEELS